MANRYQRRHGSNAAIEQAKLNKYVQIQMNVALGYGIEYIRHVAIAVMDAVLREFENSKEQLTEEAIFDIMNQITTILKAAKGDADIDTTLKNLEKEYNIKLSLDKVAEYNPAINGFLKPDNDTESDSFITRVQRQKDETSK